MKTNELWRRLGCTAGQAASPSAEEATAGFINRVLAQRAHPSLEPAEAAWDAGVLRAALAGAGVLMILTVLLSYRSVAPYEPDELSVAASVIELSMDL